MKGVVKRSLEKRTRFPKTSPPTVVGGSHWNSEVRRLAKRTRPIGLSHHPGRALLGNYINDVGNAAIQVAVHRQNRHSRRTRPPSQGRYASSLRERVLPSGVRQWFRPLSFINDEAE